MNYYACLLVNNPCYLAGAALQPQGIVVHSTGANNPELRRYIQPAAGQAMGLGGKTREAMLADVISMKRNNIWSVWKLKFCW